MKHTNSHFKILAECANGYVGICECCREYNFAYKTFLITFQEDEMQRFFEWLIANKKSPQHYMPMHHGRNRVFSSRNSNLYLTFSEEELEEIIQLYHQTQILQQAQYVLLSSRMN
ncbi:MAG: DUF6686 family protein [Bacteroidota bacterium]